MLGSCDEKCRDQQRWGQLKDVDKIKEQQEAEVGSVEGRRQDKGATGNRRIKENRCSIWTERLVKEYRKMFLTTVKALCYKPEVCRFEI
jgi:hypothetical protein